MRGTARVRQCQFRSGIPATRQEAKQMLFAYIEVFYNRERLHSALGYQLLVTFEENYKPKNPEKEEDKRRKTLFALRVRINEERSLTEEKPLPKVWL
jgi:transposase InsO family protein